MGQYLEYRKIKEPSLKGRYIQHSQIGRLIHGLGNSFTVVAAGSSVMGLPIDYIKIGQGSFKVLLWSQMHGNESTTTKALFDLLNLLSTSDPLAEKIKASCTLTILPMLNPDGANTYTRLNANGVDLNRDAQNRSQPESRILRAVYDYVKPDFCFNLHDQRTIFGAGPRNKPATLSFLSPSADSERRLTASRERGMKLIAAVNRHMQLLIPGQVGRYDDQFNSNCVGDAFQMLGCATVLVEAGHFQKDYPRERTREYVFQALLKALEVLAEGALEAASTDDYFSIPENRKNFCDLLIHNAHCINDRLEKGTSIGILYEELLQDDVVFFKPYIERRGILDDIHGHQTYDGADPVSVAKLKNQPEIWTLLNLIK